MDYFSLFLNGFCLALQGTMHILFVGKLTGKKPRAWHYAIYLFLLFILDRTARKLNLAWILAICMELITLYEINRLALKNQHSVSSIATILACYISQLSFGIVNSVEAMLFPYVIKPLLLYLFVLLATTIAFVICACCYTLVLKFTNLNENGQLSHIELLLFPILFFFTAELYIMQTSYTQTLYPNLSGKLLLAEAGKHTALLFLQVLGLGALFCTLYAYRRICREFQAQTALISLTQAAKAQKTYISEAQARYEQTKAFRHDIKNHLSVLSGLLSSGKAEEARAYLQKLEITSSHLSLPCQTGNPVVDILLSEKSDLAKANGIETEISLALPASSKIDPFDLCVIFANALDNAISACQLIQGKKSIRITGDRQGNFYLLSFENTCLDTSLPPIGTGLSNTRAIAEKYHGTMLTEISHQHFCLNVLLNIYTSD